MPNLQEGLKANDLNHLILPMLTIDEYESKIDDNRVIVVGFFVFDKEPADDLSNFIDKGSIAVLDTEVSPAPTPEGYYVVFVEFFRNADFPNTLFGILKEVQNLCDITKWQMQFPGHLEPIELTTESLTENLTLDPAEFEKEEDEVEPKKKKKKKKKKTRKRNISESTDFWLNCDADKVELDYNLITFTKNNQRYSYVIDENIPISAINLLETQQTTQLQNVLGPNYTVYAMQGACVVEHADTIRVLKSIN